VRTCMLAELDQTGESQMVRGVAAGAEPEVRIHLPPAASHERTVGRAAATGAARCSSQYPTLVRICEVLAATPNDLLLPEGKPPAQSGRDRLLARITAATNTGRLPNRVSDGPPARQATPNCRGPTGQGGSELTIMLTS
jgi:hypothetical protein